MFLLAFDLIGRIDVAMRAYVGRPAPLVRPVYNLIHNDERRDRPPFENKINALYIFFVNIFVSLSNLLWREYCGVAFILQKARVRPTRTRKCNSPRATRTSLVWTRAPATSILFFVFVRRPNTILNRGVLSSRRSTLSDFQITARIFLGEHGQESLPEPVRSKNASYSNVTCVQYRCFY